MEDVRLFQSEHVGVGGDELLSSNINVVSPLYDIFRLNEFMNKAGKVMLTLLEEKELGGNVLQSETHKFPFSEGFIKLSVNALSFLCGKSVKILDYSQTINKILLSIHSINNKVFILFIEF